MHGAVPALSARGYCIPSPIIWQAGIHRLPHQLSTAPQQRRPNPPNRLAKLAADTPNSLFRCATPAATIRLRRGASARRPARRAETIGSKLPKNPHGARSQGCGAEGSGCATSGVIEPGGRPSLGTLKNISAQQKNRHGGAVLPLSPHAARPASRELRNAAASTGRRVAKKCAFGAEWLNFELQVDGKHANLRAP